jgi:hypothetical protein
VYIRVSDCMAVLRTGDHSDTVWTQEHIAMDLYDPRILRARRHRRSSRMRTSYNLI